jgi:MFS family permease
MDSSSDNLQSTPRNVYVFGLTSFLNDTASEMAYWVLPAFLASLGAGPAQLGIIEGVAESVASFAKLFSGYITDRTANRKPIVVGGYVVANAVKPLLALVSSWWQILGIRFSDRLAKGVRGTARDVMVADSVANSSLGSAYGLIQAMDSAGAIAGPLIALLVIGRFGMRGVFAWAAVPGALCILVAWAGIREVHRNGLQSSQQGKVDEGKTQVPAHDQSPSSMTAPNTGAGSSRWLGSLPKLPTGFYYVMGVVTLFSLGNSSDMFLVLRAGNIGIPTAKVISYSQSFTSCSRLPRPSWRSGWQWRSTDCSMR